MISKQIGWSTESNLLWEILRQLSRLGGVLSNLVKNTTPKYKVFSALVTQSGGDNPQFNINTDNGNLVIGVTYEIANYAVGDDFTNIGALSNTNGVSFIATGTTAASWSGSSELNYNTGAPIVKVLENTVGNIWFSYNSVGTYYINSINLFEGTVPTVNTIFGIVEANTERYIGIEKISNSLIRLISLDSPSTSNDGLLTNTFIEFRIYP
jgi:hypothetical protein